jgi:anti-sigma factor RsiW
MNKNKETMKRNDTICSRSEVERYLLNRMSPGEETQFQQHLAHCEACLTYLNSLRALSLFVGEGLPQRLVQKKLQSSYKQRRYWLYRLPVAACILLALGIFFFRSGESLPEDGLPHEVSIQFQHRASMETDSTATCFTPDSCINKTHLQP